MRAPQAPTPALNDQPFPIYAADEPAPARFHLLAAAAGVFTTLVGMLALFGWWADIVQLTHVRADWPAMMGSTALMNILSGLSLLALAHPGSRWRKIFGVTAALLVVLVAAVSLAEWVFDWTVDIDRLLVHVSSTRGRYPGRSSPQTALTYLLLGPALALLDREPVRWLRISEVLCLLALAIPILALLGYSYGVSHFYGLLPLLPYNGLAIHTAVAAVVLAIGIFAARPQSGLTDVLTSKHAGGVAARRILIAVLTLPLASWLVILGVRAQIYPEAVGMALIVFVSLLDGLLLLLTTSRDVQRKDVALRRALLETAHWKQFFERANWGAAISDAQGTLRLVNLAYARMHGFSSVEPLIGRRVVELLSPAFRGEYLARLPDINECGRLRYESEHARSDGSTFPVLIDVAAVKDVNGRPLYSVAYVQDITQEKLAERDRARLASLVESSDDGVLAATLDGTVLHWNLAAEHIYGYSATEMIGQSVRITVPPDRLGELEASLAAVSSGEHFRTLETLRLRKDGSSFSASLTISPIKDATGRVIAVSAIVRDVSERKAAEEALALAHEAERTLSAGLERLTNASNEVSNALADLPKTGLTAVLDTIAEQARALTASDRVALGIDTEAEKPFDIWVSRGMSVAQARAIGHACDPETSAFLAVPIRHLKRSVGNLYLARRPGAAEFSAQDKHLLSLLATRAGAAIEIARLYAAEALQHAWLQAILEQMPEPVIVIDDQENIALQNGPAQALVHESGHLDACGKPLLHDIHYPSGEEVPADALPHYRALHSGESVLGTELAIATRERSIPVVASATPVRIDSRVAGAVAIFQDVSLLKELQRQREEWISVVAHDLRQPISSIALATEVLAHRRTPELPARDRESLERIRKSVDKLGRMINDLLDASRLEARRLMLDREPVNLRTSLEEITATTPELGANPVRTRFPEQAAWVSADRVRIDQIFRNLLSNAGKYGVAGQPVEVSVEPRPGAFEVSVRNHGPGISREDMRHLFQRFGRPEATKRAGIPGIGLGLYITQGLVQAHGGRVWAESTPDETTTFHVLLPAMPIDSPSVVARAG